MDTIQNPDDKRWLQETHLKGHTLPDYEIAFLIGNDDCPKMIELYKRNHHRSKPMIYMLQDDGSYVKTNDGDF